MRKVKVEGQTGNIVTCNFDVCWEEKADQLPRIGDGGGNKRGVRRGSSQEGTGKITSNKGRWGGYRAWRG